jgi:hypothetical protein
MYKIGDLTFAIYTLCICLAVIWGHLRSVFERGYGGIVGTWKVCDGCGGFLSFPPALSGIYQRTTANPKINKDRTRDLFHRDLFKSVYSKDC